MKTVQVAEEIFQDDSAFHINFAEVMGFPGFYGQNWDAWIDCMSSIDKPSDQMSKITVDRDELLEIEILIKDGNNYYKTQTWASFCSCVAAVNGRFARHESKVRLVVTEKIKSA